MSSGLVSIQFNGQAIDLAEGTTVSQLLELAEIRNQIVAVEINLEIVPREEHATHRIQEGDIVEAVTLVGGG